MQGQQVDVVGRCDQRIGANIDGCVVVAGVQPLHRLVKMLFKCGHRLWEAVLVGGRHAGDILVGGRHVEDILVGGRHAGDSASSQLAILAAAPVVATLGFLLGVARALARDTQAHPGHGVAARLGYGLPAFGTVVQARALRQSVTGAPDRILDGRVDLILNRTIFCEPTGHTAF
jgi:hypothetical protein